MSTYFETNANAAATPNREELMEAAQELLEEKKKVKRTIWTIGGLCVLVGGSGAVAIITQAVANTDKLETAIQSEQAIQADARFKSNPGIFQNPLAKNEAVVRRALLKRRHKQPVLV